MKQNAEVAAVLRNLPGHMRLFQNKKAEEGRPDRKRNLNWSPALAGVQDEWEFEGQLKFELTVQLLSKCRGLKK